MGDKDQDTDIDFGLIDLDGLEDWLELDDETIKTDMKSFEALFGNPGEEGPVEVKKEDKREKVKK
jgi:hypothetical protein